MMNYTNSLRCCPLSVKWEIIHSHSKKAKYKLPPLFVSVKVRWMLEEVKAGGSAAVISLNKQVQKAPVIQLHIYWHRNETEGMATKPAFACIWM